jgi:hypothetical protein
MPRHPEIERLVNKARQTDLATLMATIRFIQYLVKRIETITATNRPAPIISELVKPYNPSSGTAYYFTNHGGQVRAAPRYAMDKSGSTCTKIYPKVQRGNWTYLSLAFAGSTGIAMVHT